MQAGGITGMIASMPPAHPTPTDPGSNMSDSSINLIPPDSVTSAGRATFDGGVLIVVGAETLMSDLR